MITLIKNKVIVIKVRFLKEPSMRAFMSTKAPKRPMDKLMYVISATALGTGAFNITIMTSTVAETIIRNFIRGNVIKGGAAGVVVGAIVLVHVRDGQTVSTISLANVTSLYEPEQDVLWYEIFRLPVGVNAVWSLPIRGDVKGMRLMKKGDRLMILVLADTADAFDMAIATTTFLKQ